MTGPNAVRIYQALDVFDKISAVAKDQGFTQSYNFVNGMDPHDIVHTVRCDNMLHRVKGLNVILHPVHRPCARQSWTRGTSVRSVSPRLGRTSFYQSFPYRCARASAPVWCAITFQQTMCRSGVLREWADSRTFRRRLVSRRGPCHRRRWNQERRTRPEYVHVQLRGRKRQHMLR